MFRISPNLIHWRHISEFHRFEGVKCTKCGKVYFPVKYVCRQCGFDGELKRMKLSGRGTIVSYTRVYAGVPEFFEDQIPYSLAVVELEEGPRVLSQVVDCDEEEIKIGLKVKTVVRKLYVDGNSGMVYYGYKFRPIYME